VCELAPGLVLRRLEKFGQHTARILTRKFVAGLVVERSASNQDARESWNCVDAAQRHLLHTVCIPPVPGRGRVSTLGMLSPRWRFGDASGRVGELADVEVCGGHLVPPMISGTRVGRCAQRGGGVPPRWVNQSEWNELTRLVNREFEVAVIADHNRALDRQLPRLSFENVEQQMGSHIDVGTLFRPGALRQRHRIRHDRAQTV
jgi:hypothetical protein